MNSYQKLLFSLCLLACAFLLYSQLPNQDNLRIIIASSPTLSLVCSECDELGIPINLWQSPSMTTVACRIPQGQDRAVRVLQESKHRTGARMLMVHTTACDGWILAALVK